MSARAAIAVFLGLIANTALAQSVTGTATFRERIALPPAAVFEAVLEDVSRADTAAIRIAQTRFAAFGNPPIPFTIVFDPARIVANRTYVVRVQILLEERLLFTTETAVPVITRGNPTRVSILLRSTAAAPIPVDTRPLEGTHWRAIELAGIPIPARDARREAFLLFQAGGRISGSDGCNHLTGRYQLARGVLTFGQIAGTLMACVDSSGEVERAFREMLRRAASLAIAGDRLELFDETGRRVGAFVAVDPGALSSDSPLLEGTSWRLVKFQGSDGTTLTPDDRSKYTIEFGLGGQLTARIDCNRGRGTWTSNGPSLQFGPLALTRALCPPGSLHDQIVRQWPLIRSFVVRDGHLFLALMADGGIYEFEPFSAPWP